MLTGRKIGFVFALIMLLCWVKIIAQPTQLPSLFSEPDAQKEYLKNSVLQPGENPKSKIQSLIFIKTSVSKKTCFVGEPIMVTYELYTAVSCHSKVTKQVAFSNCSVIEMTSVDEPDKTVKENGAIYRVQLIRKIQLIPLQAGDLEIPPVTISNDVSFSTVENPYAEKSYTAEVSSIEKKVVVDSLPDHQPEGFTGITGKFSITAKTDSTEIAAGDNNRLQVTISGAGNIEAVTEPKVAWPKHSQHFDAIDSQHINRFNFPESGDKTFIFPFIITRKGRTSIPEISFTYFNTELKRFETITTKEIPLLIKASIKTKNPLVLMQDDLSNKKYLWFVPGIAAVVILVWLLSNRKTKKNISVVVPKTIEPVTKIEAKTNEVAKPDYGLLLQALNEAEDNATFFTNAKTLLISALQFALSPKQNNESILLNLLQNKNEELAAKAENVLLTCNRNLYSPVEDEAVRNKMIEQLSEVIDELEKR